MRTEENLTIDEALRAYTIDAAAALRFEDRIGSIEVNKLADLTMFDHDPFTADWMKQPPRVAMTVVGGRVLHEVA